MNRNVRLGALFGMLAISIGFAVVVSNDEVEIEVVGAKDARYQSNSMAVSGVSATKPLSNIAQPVPKEQAADKPREIMSDPFSVASWTIPDFSVVEPAPPAIVSAPAAAPPLPFQYLGALEDRRMGWSIQLKRGNEFLTASKGDIIDGVYELSGIEDGQLVFIYLPLKERQTLAIAFEM